MLLDKKNEAANLHRISTARPHSAQRFAVFIRKENNWKGEKLGFHS